MVKHNYYLKPIVCNNLLSKLACFPVIFQPLHWSLLSDHTSPVVQYRVYCTAAYVKPDQIIWRMNNTIVLNSSSTTISHQLLDEATDNYTNILTVTGDYHTQTISCEADYVSGPFYNNELKPLTITGLAKYTMTVTLHSMLAIITIVSSSQWPTKVCTYYTGGTYLFLIQYHGDLVTSSRRS